MKLIITLDSLFKFGIIGLFLVIALVCFLYAVIDVYTREFRYKHFKCPKCKNYNGKSCSRMRNYREECKWFIKKNKGKINGNN